jgi:hypothetical protein
MTHSLGARHLLGALTVVTCMGLTACAFNPMSQTALPGSTIVVPLIGERLISIGTSEEHADASAFGTPSIADPQRGQLYAMMCPDSETYSMPGCALSANKVDVPIRYVTRVYPDPASQAGIENLIDGFTPELMSSIPMSGQVLLVADIPPLASLGTWPTCSGSPCPIRTFFFYVGRHRPFGGGDETSILNSVYYRQLKVAYSTTSGVSSPAQSLYPYGPTVNLTRLVPYPKVVLTANSTAQNNVGAADLTITVPSTVTVKDVIEEEHLGRHTMVRWNTVSSTSIHVTLVSPDKTVNRLAVVFDLNGGASSAPAYSAFPVSSSTLYDQNGNVLGGGAAFAPEVIR